MAINKNHEFEELAGFKCGIVEKNASTERVAFLKAILEYNQYQVIIVPSPPQKAVVKPAVAESLPVIPGPETFTIGVTDYTFNPVNAIFGRLLKAPDNQVITLAYWNQENAVNRDDIPYYDRQP